MRRLAYSPGERFRIHRDLCRVRRSTNRTLVNWTVDRCILEGQSVKQGQSNSTNVSYFQNELGDEIFETSEKEYVLE